MASNMAKMKTSLKISLNAQIKWLSARTKSWKTTSNNFPKSLSYNLVVICRTLFVHMKWIKNVGEDCPGLIGAVFSFSPNVSLHMGTCETSRQAFRLLLSIIRSFTTCSCLYVLPFPITRIIRIANSAALFKKQTIHRVHNLSLVFNEH